MSERTAWRLVAVCAIALGLAGPVYFVESRHNGWRERQQLAVEKADDSRAAHRARRAAVVEECRTLGGVPIIDWRDMLTRCDFPPAAVQR